MSDQDSLRWQPSERPVGLLDGLDDMPAGGILGNPRMALALMMMGRGVNPMQLEQLLQANRAPDLAAMGYGPQLPAAAAPYGTPAARAETGDSWLWRQIMGGMGSKRAY
jgi:hypothetical protein